MSDNPAQGIAAQKLQVLFSGTGYNFYDDKNKMRADDLLVRQKASAALADAAQTLTTLDSEFRRRYVPPASRQNPFPPADVMEQVREIGRVRDRARDLSSRILTMPAPAQDKVWFRFRQEATLLTELFTFDYNMVEQTQQFCEKIAAITADTWRAGGQASTLESALSTLEMTIKDRWQLLTMPT
jgi:hypothetical protein